MRTANFFLFGIVTLLLFGNSRPAIDITDEQAVINSIQGEWIGYESIAGEYRHIKLKFSDDGYEGWLQTTGSTDNPEWAEMPNETGLFSMSAVQQYSNGAGKFRTIRFTILGSCCGDNSLTAWTLSQLIIYDEAKGLYIGGRQAMTKN